jgi:uncharacterized membrane protein
LSDSKSRSLIKTISWRLTGSFSTFLISYLILRNFTVAGSIAVIQVVANTVLYYLHERVWSRIKWGIKSY